MYAQNQIKKESTRTSYTFFMHVHIFSKCHMELPPEFFNDHNYQFENRKAFQSQFFILFLSVDVTVVYDSFQTLCLFFV